MSATLTWYNSGLGAKTGTTIGAAFTDLKALIDSKAGDSNFKWEVKGSNIASTPYYLLLGRKDGSVGRILIVNWSSAPAGNNAAILDTAPQTNTFYIAWFPNGNASTASNLTASSGTIAGDDTNCVKVSIGNTVASGYTTNQQWFYFDCEDGIVLFSQNPASSVAQHFLGAGDLLIDASDTAYGCTFGAFNVAHTNFAGNATTIWSYAAANQNAGNTTPCVRSNYGSSNRQYYQAFECVIWTVTMPSSTDILTDTSANKAWFVPVLLLASQIKGGGFQLKLRQIAIGPGSTGAFTTYSTTGPVVKARQASAFTGGNVISVPWFVNFKL